jgi:uncharacterized protein (TIGR02265 family)
MDERKAKGTVLLDFIRMIKANKHLDWSNYLKPEDWEIFDSIILPAKWYPFDLYYRCSFAVFNVLGKGDMAVARAFGQSLATKLFETTYTSMVQRQDPMLGLQHFAQTYGSLFNFSLVRMEKVGPRHARMFHDFEATDKGNDAYGQQLKGMFEVLVQKTGGKNGKVEIGAKQWEGASATSFEVTWE